MASVSIAPPAPGAPPLRPENLVGLKALAEEHDLEFPWDEWEALLVAADDTPPRTRSTATATA